MVTLAFALLHLDKAGQAIELLDSWIQSNPENPEFHAARGIVSLTTDYESAIRDFEQAVKYRTKSALPYLEYSNWLLHERRYQDAVDTAQNGLRWQLRASDRAKLLHLMGIGFAFTNSLDRAVQLMKEAKQLDPIDQTLSANLEAMKSSLGNSALLEQTLVLPSQQTHEVGELLRRLAA